MGTAPGVAIVWHIEVVPRPPSDDVTTPRCMSWMGGNCGAPVAQLPLASDTSGAPLTTMALPWLSTQLGVTRRWIRSGMAAWRYCCLSPIDNELSMSNRMSTLLTATVGCAVSIGTGDLMTVSPG